MANRGEPSRRWKENGVLPDERIDVGKGPVGIEIRKVPIPMLLEPIVYDRSRMSNVSRVRLPSPLVAVPRFGSCTSKAGTASRSGTGPPSTCPWHHGGCVPGSVFHWWIGCLPRSRSPRLRFASSAPGMAFCSPGAGADRLAGPSSARDGHDR
jgi:hypothetical protein